MADRKPESGVARSVKPWDIMADLLHRQKGWPLEQCYDDVISFWLYQAEPRPLLDRLFKGADLGPRTRIALRRLLCDEVPPGLEGTVQVQLVFKNRQKR